MAQKPERSLSCSNVLSRLTFAFHLSASQEKKKGSARHCCAQTFTIGGSRLWPMQQWKGSGKRVDKTCCWLLWSITSTFTVDGTPDSVVQIRSRKNQQRGDLREAEKWKASKGNQLEDTKLWGKNKKTNNHLKGKEEVVCSIGRGFLCVLALGT